MIWKITTAVAVLWALATTFVLKWILHEDDTGITYLDDAGSQDIPPVVLGKSWQQGVSRSVLK